MKKKTFVYKMSSCYLSGHDFMIWMSPSGHDFLNWRSFMIWMGLYSAISSLKSGIITETKKGGNANRTSFCKHTKNEGVA